MNHEHKRTNICLATICFVFNPAKYQHLAAKHKKAVVLESLDLAQKYKKGEFVIDENEYLSSALEHYFNLKKYFYRSLFIILAIIQHGIRS